MCCLEFINPSRSHQHTNPYFSRDICNSVVKIYMNYEINKKQKSGHPYMGTFDGKFSYFFFAR